MKVEVENLTFQVPSFRLGPLDFTVGEGTITAIIGKNGSGKSTTLKLIHGDQESLDVLRKYGDPIKTRISSTGLTLLT